MSETFVLPDDLVIPLRCYQKDWLVWALKQEESSRGGILADEKGMGKTLQAITLVLLKRKTVRGFSGHGARDLPSIKGTLVCPLKSLMHWVSEIGRCTSRGSIKWSVYYGPNRANGCQFSDYDLVITTYSTVEIEYRNALPGKSILHSLMWDRIILDEAHYKKHRRSGTSKAVHALESSYKWALIDTPFQRPTEELYSLVRFLRIVPYAYYFYNDCDCCTLDYSTSTECTGCPHKMVQHFWWWGKYISSPIQASGDTGFSRDAMLLLHDKILEDIMLRRTKKETVADLASIVTLDNDALNITDSGIRIMLRLDALDTTEQNEYAEFYKGIWEQYFKYFLDGAVLKNYATIVDLLTRLQQAAAHPYLVEYPPTPPDTSKYEKCCLCHDDEEDPVVTLCGHAFCKRCLMDFAANMEKTVCPSCLKPLTIDLTSDKNAGVNSSSTILTKIQLSSFRTSTKIEGPSILYVVRILYAYPMWDKSQQK